jgi:hypothetical protein
MEVCIANEKAAFALSNGVAGENVGNGNKDTVDSKSSNKRFESIHRAVLAREYDQRIDVFNETNLLDGPPR